MSDTLRGLEHYYEQLKHLDGTSEETTVEGERQTIIDLENEFAVNVIDENGDVCLDDLRDAIETEKGIQRLQPLDQ